MRLLLARKAFGSMEARWGTGEWLFVAEPAIEGAEGLVEAVFGAMEGEIPGAGVVNLMAAESLLVLGEAVPRVFGVGRSGDAPEIKGGGAIMLGVDDGLDGDDGAGGELLVLAVGGGVGRVADAIVIVDESGSDRTAFEIGNVEGGEAGFELILEVSFVLGGEMIAGAKGIKEADEDADLLGVSSVADREAALSMIAPFAKLVFFEVRKNLIFGGGKVDDPSVGRVELVRGEETVIFHGLGGEGASWLDANEETALFAGELLEGDKGMFEGGNGIGGVEGRAVGAIEVGS